MQTFSGPPTYYEVSGPGTLVRLVQFKKTTYDCLQLRNSDPQGLFWFEEDFLMRVRNQARLDLARQQAQSKRSFSAPFNSLVTLYMRHFLRNDLAVCKDWTNDFDGYVKMRLFPSDRVVALVGAVARQPAYSPEDPEHDKVMAKNIILDGRATQYVIDFRSADNKAYAKRIQSPSEL
jgi:hypothetical protein